MQEILVQSQPDEGGEELYEHRSAIGRALKLGNQRVFYQKGTRIVAEELAGGERAFSSKQFSSLREAQQSGIKRFRDLNAMEEGGTLRLRRRANSVDTSLQGCYYLNNWLSHQEFPCERSDDRYSVLIYEILELRFNRVLEILAVLPRTPETATLEHLLLGFKTIKGLVEDDQALSMHFLGRSSFAIGFKQTSQSLVTLGTYLDLLDELGQGRAKFYQIRTPSRKLECLNSNLDFLVRFARKYTNNPSNGYLALAFRLLGNSYDQAAIDNQPHSDDYAPLLLSLDIRLSDRLNFATKLLPTRRRRDFNFQLQDTLSRFPRLQNILFYGYHPSKSKQEYICKIAEKYLDEYSDLQTVAYLALDLPCLRRYYSLYRQTLQLAAQHKDFERLEGYKSGGEKGRGWREQKCGHKQGWFLAAVNAVEEKIGEWRTSGEGVRVCQICCKKIAKGETYLECGKCLHGGHIPHLLKWLQEYQNCPHIDCPCLCN